MNDISPSVRSLAVDARRRAAGYRDVMVHLDGGEEDENRLAHAEAIAGLSGAHLTGLYTNMLPDSAFYAEGAGAAAFAEITWDVLDQGAATQASMEARFARLSVTGDVRRVEDVSGLLPRLVATEARWADLFVVSCPYHFRSLHDWDSMVEAVMFEGGHGLYLVPRGVKPRARIETAMIGWVDTREAARAVAEALPLLRLATKTELVGVQEPAKGRLGGGEAMADIATHLARHGIETTVTVMPSGENVAAALLDRAHHISADLIVAGAYGHSRMREWILGGATQDLIRTSDLPLFMAH
ncbi:universal stress protein [Labrys monachus]|uniref:Nucleotide-binding universal stress UspA family protein n=1 Tax=Labrys monachus TaxID=217067 RepID=A0ABU0FGS3_9HYPH|nr:universal stress protein [Labrys monachus]MDQ0393303.1 nucleotide-binding universal stress UspA family protein [Labrys monachus]